MFQGSEAEKSCHKVYSMSRRQRSIQGRVKAKIKKKKKFFF